jgi:hypothetical protein
MSLATLQDRLQACVLSGERAIESQVIGASPEDVAARLAIYTNAYRMRLTEALASNFPALAQLLGAGDFATMAGHYMASHVSHHASIRYFGDVLPQFLASDARYREVSLLTELAAWEWAMTEVFDAADAQAVGVESLASRPPAEWAELRFTLHPAVRRLDLRWNVPSMWKALTSDSARPTPELADEPRAWLLWRANLQVMFRSLDATEAAALDAVNDGQDFGELCVRLCDRADEASAPIQAAAYLRAWMEAGLIAGARSR